MRLRVLLTLDLLPCVSDARRHGAVSSARQLVLACVTGNTTGTSAGASFACARRKDWRAQRRLPAHALHGVRACAVEQQDKQNPTSQELASGNPGGSCGESNPWGAITLQGVGMWANPLADKSIQAAGTSDKNPEGEPGAAGLGRQPAAQLCGGRGGPDPRGSRRDREGGPGSCWG